MTEGFECIVEIFEGINIKVKFNTITGQKKDIEIFYTGIVDCENRITEIKFSKNILNSLKELVKDEIDSISFGDSTVKASLINPN